MPEEKRRRYLLFLLFFMVVGSGVFWITRMNGNGDDHSVAKSSTIAKNNVAASTSFEKRTIATTKQNQPAPEKNITVPSNASEANTRKPDEVSSINEANSTDNKNNVTSNISASTKKISAVNKPSQRRKNPGSIAADEKMATGSTTLTGKKSKEKAKQPIGESL